MDIALLQLNPTIGDLASNARKTADGVRSAHAQGADLVVASELCLLGYPPRDLLLSEGFVARGWQVLHDAISHVRSSSPLMAKTDPVLKVIGSVERRGKGMAFGRGWSWRVVRSLLG